MATTVVVVVVIGFVSWCFGFAHGHLAGQQDMHDQWTAWRRNPVRR